MHRFVTVTAAVLTLAACGPQEARIEQGSASPSAPPDAGAPTRADPTTAGLPAWADLSGRWTLTLTLEPRIATRADGGVGRTAMGRGTASLPVELAWKNGAWVLEAFLADGTAATVVAPRVEASVTRDTWSAVLPAQSFLVLPGLPLTLSGGGITTQYAPSYAMFIRLLEPGQAQVLTANRVRFARVAADTTEGFGRLPTEVGDDAAASFVTLELTR